MTGPARVRPAAALLLVVGLAAWVRQSCHPRPAGTDAAVRCEPVAGEVPPGTSPAALAGEFRLTLVATRGARAGGQATGTLRLQPFGGAPSPVPAAAGVEYPLHGATWLELHAVGAVVPGEIERVDPAAPGVLVMAWDAAPGRRQITLRLGSGANRAGNPRFDGAFTALTVHRVDGAGFAGGWESGTGGESAAGHFCAVRTQADRAAARG